MSPQNRPVPSSLSTALRIHAPGTDHGLWATVLFSFSHFLSLALSVITSVPSHCPGRGAWCVWQPRRTPPVSLITLSQPDSEDRCTDKEGISGLHSHMVSRRLPATCFYIRLFTAGQSFLRSRDAEKHLTLVK